MATRKQGLRKLLLASCWLPAPVVALEEVAVLRGAGFEPAELAIHEATNRLYVTNRAAPGTLHIFDAQTLAALAQPMFAREIGFPFVHQAAARLYLFDFDFSIGADPPVLHVLDANNGQELTSFPQSLGARLVDESLGRVFILSGWNLTAIDTDDHARTTVALGGCGLSAGFALNAVTHELFVASLHCNELKVVDGSTLAVTTLATPRARFLAANPQENKVYGTTINWGGYWILDRDTNATPVVTSCATDATELFYDAASNRVLSNAEVNDDFVTIEGGSDSCMLTEVGAHTSGLHSLPAPSRVLQPASSFLAVVDAANQVFKLPLTPPEGQGKLTFEHRVAVHTGLRRVYVSSYQFGDEHSQDALGVYADSVAPHPLPAIATVATSTGFGNVGSVRVAVYGSNFSPGASLRWRGFFTSNPDRSDMVTTWISPTELRAFVPRGAVLAETATVSVRNPGPGGGTSNSLPVTLTSYSPFLLPPNDLHANATPVGVLPFVDSVITNNAGSEALDPVPACQPGGASTRSVWYRFVAGASGELAVDTLRSSYDTILQVLGGGPGAFVSLACSDDAAGTAQSKLRVAVTAGNSYHLLVTSYDGSGGLLELRVRDALVDIHRDGFETPPL